MYGMNRQRYIKSVNYVSLDPDTTAVFTDTFRKRNQSRNKSVAPAVPKVSEDSSRRRSRSCEKPTARRAYQQQQNINRTSRLDQQPTGNNPTADDVRATARARTRTVKNSQYVLYCY